MTDKRRASNQARIVNWSVRRIDCSRIVMKRSRLTHLMWRARTSGGRWRCCPTATKLASVSGSEGAYDDEEEKRRD